MFFYNLETSIRTFVINANSAKYYLRSNLIFGQFSNISSPISVTLSGICTLLKLKQDPNKDPKKDLMTEPKVLVTTDWRLTQSLNT